MAAKKSSSGMRARMSPAKRVSSPPELPPFELNVTSTVIVAGAIASRDFMPAHHDPTFAKAQGAPDMFMNILTTNGYIARYVTGGAHRAYKGLPRPSR